MAEGKKRLVKNPETFRERALKEDQPKEKNPLVGSVFAFPFKALAAFFRGIRNQYIKLSKIKSLKPIFVVLSLLGKLLWPTYFRNSFKELQGVTWPGGKLSLRLTYAVIAFAVVFGIAIAFVDFILDKVFKVVLLK